MPITRDRPLAVYHEHPDWFRPLFAELDRRGTPYVRIDADDHLYEAGRNGGPPPYSLFFNRMSPSAYLRGRGHEIFYTLQYLAHLESEGVRVVNGTKAYTTELSKARQLDLIASLGLPGPRARVISQPRQAPAAAEGLRFPVVVKPNIGGSGAGVVRFDSPAQLATTVELAQLDLGIDSTALVQEFIPQRDGRVTRVEVLGGKYLYAINIYTTGESFNLCPADVCQTTGGAELTRAACAIDAPKNGLRVEGYDAPPETRDAVERIMAAAGIEVGGVEYFTDERDGRLYYYDVNALSNFVADAPRVIGFDPFARLVDWLEQEAR
ncbi:MAG TPA: hypothetical protein VF832_06905 [Longimicrobiales bacterium]